MLSVARLRALLDELSRTHDALSRLIDPTPGACSTNARPISVVDEVALLRLVLASRRRLERVLDVKNLCSATRDMLIELHLIRRQSKTMSVSALCIAGRVPQATGLRKIQWLEDQGLIEREQDPKDRRRQHVRLTERGERAMRSWTQSAYAAIDEMMLRTRIEDEPR